MSKLIEMQKVAAGLGEKVKALESRLSASVDGQVIAIESLLVDMDEILNEVIALGGSLEEMALGIRASFKNRGRIQ